MTRVASIDLGTNTIRLLVIDVARDGRWTPVTEAQAIARLGEGFRVTGRLGEAPMARAMAIVADFLARARALGAGRILIVGTSAVRDAVNGTDFCGRLAQATGETVRVVPGEEEGRLTLLGVLRGLPSLSGSFVVFDIGGGSTEFTLARDRALVGARSLALGVVPLAERYATADPVDRMWYAELEEEVRGLLAQELGDLLGRERPEHLVGTAGTVTTVAAIGQGLPVYDPAKIHGYRLRRSRIEALLEMLAPLPAEERARVPCLEPGRADLIIPGIAICLATMSVLGVDALVVSEFGLREGILIDHLSHSSA